MSIDYENATTEQRAEALKALGLSISSVCTDAGEAHIFGQQKGRESKWIVTIQGPKGAFSSPYSQGCAHRNYKGRPIPQIWGTKLADSQARALKYSRPNVPDIVSVLYCLVSDAELGNDTFEDFCGNLGLDADSRKALETYLECQDTSAKFRALGVSFQAISDIVRGY